MPDIATLEINTDPLIATLEIQAVIEAGGGGGGSGANLSVTRTSTTVTVASDSGTDATLSAADASNAGVMTAAMFTKLDGIATGATANSSDATLLARANPTGTQAISTVTGLQAALDGKASSTHTHSISDVTGLQTALDAKAPTASPTFTGTVGVTGAMELGVPESASGAVALYDVASIYTVALTHAGLTGYRTINLPDSDGTVALIDSPAFSGTPLAPTASTSDSSTQIATTALVTNKLAAFTGSANIVTIGTVTSGTWSADTIAVNKGGTGQTSYTDGQLLIGNSTGNTLAKATLTAGSNITITNGPGTITIAATGGGGSPGGSTTQLQYNNAGAFGGISGATTDGTNVTYGSGNLLATSPKVTTQICDTNGNPWLVQTATGSAVYGLRLTNAAAGGTVTVAAQAPTQASATVAGTPLTISASAATVGTASGTGAGGLLSLNGGAGAAFSGTAAGGSVIATAAASSDGFSGASLTLSGGRNAAGVTLAGGMTSGTAAHNMTISTATNSSIAAGNAGSITIQPGGYSGANASVDGGGLLLTTSAGGARTSTGVTAGNGGPQTITLGAGGAISGATGTGGNGGGWSVVGGAGGAATGTTSATGGTGSAISITSGNGGAATPASGTRTGGNSGTVTIATGNGGNGSTTNGNSANLILATGSPGAGAGSAGTTGSVQIKPGGSTQFEVKTDAIVCSKPVAFPSYTVAGLPSAASYPYHRAFVTDATATTFASTVAGGGANKVPVFSDGTNWIIG